MGVSFFSCDECGLVMNDHGEPSSQHLEYKENGITKDGTYCEDCASDIKSGKVPIMSDLTIVFCLQKQDQEDIFIKFPELNKTSLKKLITELQTCDMVAVKEVEYNNASDNDQKQIFEKAFKKENFQDPKTTYEFFISEFIGELDDIDEEFSWIVPPIWPDKKCLKLENEISVITSQIISLENKANGKKRKLETIRFIIGKQNAFRSS